MTPITALYRRADARPGHVAFITANGIWNYRTAIRKLPTVLPIAILLGAVSAAPAPAQTPSHHVVQPHRHVRVSPALYGSDGYDSFGMQPRQGQRRDLGGTGALPWIEDPGSPGG
jgi:hypothetical protein